MISSYRARPTTRPAGHHLALAAPCLDTLTSTNKISHRPRPRTLRTTLRRLPSLPPTSIVLSRPIYRYINKPCRRDTLRLRRARITPMPAPRRTTTPLRHTTPPPTLPRRHSDIPHITDTTTAMISPMALEGRHRRPSRLSLLACHILRTLQQERLHTNRLCPQVHLHSLLSHSPRHMPLRATVLDTVPTVAARAPQHSLPTLRLHTPRRPICRHTPRMMAVPTLTTGLVGQTHKVPPWRRHICNLLDLPG